MGHRPVPIWCLGDRRSGLSRGGAAPRLGTIALDSAAYDVPWIMNGPHPALYDARLRPGRGAAARGLADPWSSRERPSQCCSSAARIEQRRVVPQADAFGVAVRAHGSTATVLPIDMSHGDIDSQVGVAGPLTSAVDDYSPRSVSPT